MAWRVVWTDRARRDLLETAKYIAQDSRTYAAVFVRRIRNAARSLNELPRRGRVVPELGDERVRELLPGNHRLIYELHSDIATVAILAVIHGARDLVALWKREGHGQGSGSGSG